MTHPHRTPDQQLASLERHVTRRAHDRLDALALTLGITTPPPPTDAERWAALAKQSDAILDAFTKGIRRIAIAYPILIFGSPQQQAEARALLGWDRRS